MKKIILKILVLFSFFGCSTDNSNSDIQLSLPPETQIGANTFGCYVNGKLLVPRNGSGTFAGSDYGALLYGGYPVSTDYYELDVRDYKSERTARILIHM